MKIIQVLTTSILFLLPGAIVPAYARGQHEQEKQPEQKQAKPAQQPQRAAQQKQAKPAQQPQHAAQQREAKPAQQPQHAAQQREAKPAQQPQHAAQQREAKPAQQPQHAAQRRETKPSQQPQHAAQQANRGQSAGSHGSIPEARFRSNFGRGHTFHVNRSQFANGPGRFQYGGYWFNTVDSWPAGWLYTDDVYVDYLNGGYFLCDPVHPGVYISINIG
jgi:hypothetical protein